MKTSQACLFAVLLTGCQIIPGLGLGLKDSPELGLDYYVFIGDVHSSFFNENEDAADCYPRLAGLRREFEAYGIQVVDASEGSRFDDTLRLVAIKTADMDVLAEICAQYGAVKGLHLLEKPWPTAREFLRKSDAASHRARDGSATRHK